MFLLCSNAKLAPVKRRRHFDPGHAQREPGPCSERVLNGSPIGANAHPGRRARRTIVADAA